MQQTFMAGEIDWEKLATEVGALHAGLDQGSNALAKRAVERLLGEENLRAAVDHFVARRPGAELVRSLLWQLQPWAAMEHCHQLVRGSPDIQVRHGAVELLRVIADERALPWVEELLTDPDEHIQNWGAGLLDHLLCSRFVSPTEVMPQLALLRDHANGRVREMGAFIHGYLGHRPAS
jgi:hypothetical protein